MADYKGRSLEDQLTIFRAEMAHTFPALQQASQMWGIAQGWLDPASRSLRDATKALEPNWDDDAGHTMVQWLRDTYDNSLAPWQRAAAESHVKEHIDTLIGMLAVNVWFFASEATKAVNDPDYKPKAQEAVGTKLNEIAQQYLRTGHAMLAARSRPWNGARGDIDPGTEAQPVPGRQSPSSANPSGTPGNPSPGAEPDSTQSSPGQLQNAQDPAKAALEEAPKALDALSKALESLQQLGPAIPNPVTPDSAGGLPSWDPASLSPSELANYSGLPSLAGGGGGLPGGVGGAGAGMTAGSPMANPVQPTGMNGAALPPGASGATAGTAAGTAGSGMMPPMYPPQTAGARAGGGVQPGVAEYAGTGRPRERKPSGTPGVSLLGRAGRGQPAKGAAQPPSSRRGWDTENDTVQLLDEELWQVNPAVQMNQEDNGPRYRAGQ
jgi:hypothetical protein